MSVRGHWKRFWMNLKRRRRLRRFDRQARIYLQESLQPRLRLSKPVLFADHYSRKKYVADSPGGKVFIKLYRGRTVKKARRYVALHSILARSGMRIPELIAHDTAPHVVKRHGLGSLVLQWVEGGPIQPGDDPAARAALANLGRLHRIGAAECAVPNAGKTELAPAPLLTEQALAAEAEAMIEECALALPGFGASERRLAREVAARSLRGLYAEETPPSLLHRDYGSSNVIRTPTGEIVTLDFENARLGPLGLDLGPVLLLFAYDQGIEELAETELEELMVSPRFDPLLQSYFSTAPHWAAAAWQKHRRPALAWGRLALIGNLCKKSANPFRYDRAERRRHAREARRHWEQLARYARSEFAVAR